jgi:hypothetical protein
MPRAYLVTLGLLAFFDVVLVGAVWRTGSYGWIAENGPLELFEIALLLIAVILFGWRARQAGPPVRLINVTASVLCASFLIWEIEFRGTAMPAGFVKLFHDDEGKELMMLAIGVALAAYLLAQRRYWRGAVRALLRPQLAAYIAGGMMLALGALFEGQAGPKIWIALEEVSEMNAFVLLILAALAVPYRERPAG